MNKKKKQLHVKLNKAEVSILTEAAKDNNQTAEELIHTIIHMFIHSIMDEESVSYIS